jgi:hypothetical protein
VQTSTHQRAAELTAFINGIPLDAPPGFVAQTHPLLLQHHDIPAFMDAMESKFRSLRALGVADEYKMHADLFLNTIMMFIGPFISSLTERYHRKLGTSRPFDLMELKGLLRTYETSRYLDRDRRARLSWPRLHWRTRDRDRAMVLVEMHDSSRWCQTVDLRIYSRCRQQHKARHHLLQVDPRLARAMPLFSKTRLCNGGSRGLCSRGSWRRAVVLVQMHDSSRWCQTADLRIYSSVRGLEVAKRACVRAYSVLVLGFT